MSEPRLELVIECEHGEMVTHEFFHGPCGPEHHVCDKPDRCPGGSRRVLDPGSYLLIRKDNDGEWPLDVRTPLNSWAHRWPATSAHNILDHLCDLQNLGGALAALEGRE